MNHRSHVLIIGDVQHQVGALRDSLADLAEVNFAPAGRLGVATAQADQPDLILLDLDPAGQDSLQALDALKKDRRTASIPVLLLTDRSDADGESRGLVRGAKDVILKPLRSESVRSRVEMHLTLEHQAKALRSQSAVLPGRSEPQSQLLAQALARVEANVRSNSSFLARVSHELRAPLNTLMGLAQGGMREAAAGRPAEPHYARILASGQRLLGVVNDLIDYSQLEAGLLTVQRQALDLAQVVGEAVQQLEPVAAAKGLSLQVTWQAPQTLAVIGEACRIQQVLVHLLSNAVKFTDAGHVHLDVRQTDEHVLFEVSDTGRGMTQAELDNLFRAVETGTGDADWDTSAEPGGLGLGLVICRHLAEAMGGTLEVSSLPGEGTEVKFTLMRAGPGDTAAPTSQSFVRGRLRGLRILAVEDIEINRFLLTRIFEQEGAEFHFEENGRDALAAASVNLNQTGEPAFDVVLMDVQMPLMDGYEATRRLRNIAPGLPVIGLTAHSQPQERARSLDSGMVAHLSKPVDVDELVAAVLRACGREVPDWRLQPAAAMPLAGRDLPRADEEASRAVPHEEHQEVHDPAAEAKAGSQTADAQPTAPVIDWQTLSRSMGMGDTFATQLAQALLRNLQAMPQALREAAQSRNHATLGQDAHTVKGIAGNVKAQVAFERAKLTETAAKDLQESAFALALALAVDVEDMMAAAQGWLSTRV